MMFTSSIIVATGLVSLASCHGIVLSPPVRAVGAAMNASCGTAVTAIVKADNTSHIEGLPEAAATDPTYKAAECNLFLCKGLQFADNKENVQTFTPGQVVNIKVDLSIPHTGPANVSVVSTKTNTVLDKAMISFPVYADDEAATLPANNTNFNVTMPTTLGNKCAVAGDCVVQWFWLGTEAEQTYESCTDFTMSGSANSTAKLSGASTSTSMTSSGMSMSMKRTGASRRAQGIMAFLAMAQFALW